MVRQVNYTESLEQLITWDIASRGAATLERQTELVNDVMTSDDELLDICSRRLRRTSAHCSEGRVDKWIG